MEKIKIDDFTNYSFLSNITYSPDGLQAAFTLKKANMQDNGYDGFLYLLRDNEVLKLTNNGKEGNFIWLNKDEILFSTIRREDQKRAEAKDIFTSFYKISTKGGEAIKAFDVALMVEKIVLLQDGRYLLKAAFNKKYPDYYQANDEEKQKIAKEYEDNKDYWEVDEVPFWFNGAGFINGIRRGLFIYDDKTKQLQRITEALFNVDDFVEINGKIYFSGAQQIHSFSLHEGLYEYDLNEKTIQMLIEPKEYNEIGLLKNKDNLFLMMSDTKDYGIDQDYCLYAYDVNSGKLEKKIEEFSCHNSTGSDCRLGSGTQMKETAEGFCVVQTKRNAAVLSEYSNDQLKVLLNEEGSVECFDVFQDEILMIRMKTDQLQEVYRLNRKTKELKQLTHFNDDVLKDRYIALPEKMTIQSCGWEIDGWVLKPKDYDEHKKYPAILDIHGGPKTVYGEVFYHEMQLWASEGYFVFFCNPKGGDGRGSAFTDIRGEYGVTDYQNIMDFTDEVLKKYPTIDSKKVCVTGGSYGGFMTNWIVGHTDRFCAAATQRSISNWISFYGMSDIGIWFAKDQTGTKGIEIEKMWQQSPLKYADNVKTPLLFIHSDEDYRCPLEQGVQFFASLKERNVETKMVIFHGENHELSRGGKPAHRIKRLKEITDWFNNHI